MKGWQHRLTRHAPKGITGDDVAQWAWILTGDNADIMMERFLGSKCHKPVFLLLMLVGKDRVFAKPENIAGFLEYLYTVALDGAPPTAGQAPPTVTLGEQTIKPSDFSRLLVRLTRISAKYWPPALVSIGHLAAEYVARIEPDEVTTRQKFGQKVRNHLFNLAIVALRRAADVMPLINRTYNWEAQKVLLLLSSTTTPRLEINQASYRAMREVLLSLKKTPLEKKVAQRAAKTWPPYRQEWDGLDERRNPEDDISRSVKAGKMAIEAGYQPLHIDRAMSTLGGSGPDRAPTIQTRTLMAGVREGNMANHNIYLLWAAHVKATRNAREAWAAFQTCPDSGLEVVQNIDVYAEMFEKLFAPEVHNPFVMPGDSREVFPVSDGNLSRWEIARLTPPNVDELYDRMIRQGIVPHGRCLSILLRNAGSRERGLWYLQDSMHSDLVPMLKGGWPGQEGTRLLRGVPPTVMTAYVSLLCSTHWAGVQEADGPSGTVSRYDTQIWQAIRIARAYDQANLEAYIADKRPFYLILAALSGRKMMYHEDGQHKNNMETLDVFLKIYEETVRVKGPDVRLFTYLSLAISKALRIQWLTDTPEGKVIRPSWDIDRGVSPLISRAQELLGQASSEVFRVVESPEQVRKRLKLPMFRYKITAQIVYSYIRALGVLGDGAGMVEVMGWVLDAWGQEALLEDAKSPHDLDYQYLMRAWAYFGGMAGRVVSQDESDAVLDRLEHLQQNEGCTWGLDANPDPLVDDDAEIAMRRRDANRGGLNETWCEPTDGAFAAKLGVHA